MGENEIGVGTDGARRNARQSGRFAGEIGGAEDHLGRSQDPPRGLARVQDAFQDRTELLDAMLIS